MFAGCGRGSRLGSADPIAEAIRAVGLRHIRSFLGEAEALEWLNEGVAADRLLAANPKPAQSISEAIE